MDNEQEYMREHPPRCLGGFVEPTSDQLRTFLQEQLGENSTVFSPVCECSNRFVTVASSEETRATTISCPKCGKVRVVFDPTQHGYDGELGLNDGLELAQPAEKSCPKCGNRTQQAGLCFQYSGETDVLVDDDPPDVSPEDLFGWVTIAGQCEKCGTVQMIGEEECA